MSLLDNASYYLGRGIGSADNAAKGLKIQAEITRLQSQKKDLIQQLGQIAYERCRSNDDVCSAFSQEFASISEIEERMAVCRGQLVELQGGNQGNSGEGHGITCTKCGTVNSTGFAFCVGCGAKMPTKSVFEGDWVCTACGASYGEEMQFCMQCGSPVRRRNEQVSSQMSIEPNPVEPEDTAVKVTVGSAVCPDCGSPVEADDVFCGECGRVL